MIVPFNREIKAQRCYASCSRAAIQEVVQPWVWVGTGWAGRGLGVAGKTAGPSESVGVH